MAPFFVYPTLSLPRRYKTSQNANQSVTDTDCDCCGVYDCVCITESLEDNAGVRGCGCVRGCAGACERVRVCVRGRAGACVRLGVCSVPGTPK